MSVGRWALATAEPVSGGLGLGVFCKKWISLGVLSHGALSILTALTSIFIVATVSAKIRGLDITCGCFGHAGRNWSFSSHLALDFVLLGGLIALCFAHGKNFRADGSQL